MDCKRAAEAVRACYTLAGLPAPRIEFAQSFQTAPLAARVDIRSTVLTAVRGEVLDAVGGEVGDAVWSGQYDADTCAVLRFCTDVLGVKLPTATRARLDAWCAVVESCGGVYWGRDSATIVDRPEVFERDSDGRITAVVYRDGWKVQV